MHLDALRPDDRSGVALSDRRARAESRGPGAPDRERRRLGPGLVPERVRSGAKINMGCPGGPGGWHSRRTSAEILGWWYGTADCLSRHSRSAKASTSLD